MTVDLVGPKSKLLYLVFKREKVCLKDLFLSQLYIIEERDVITDDYYDNQYESEDYKAPASTFDESDYEQEPPRELRSGRVK